MHSAPREGVEVDRKGGDQRFALAGLHFSDLAVVQHHAADQLHVEVPHIQDAAARLAHHGESLRENLIQDLILNPAALVVVFNVPGSFLDSRPELVRLGAQFGIAEPLHLGFKRANLLNIWHRALDFALVVGAENLT